MGRARDWSHAQTARLRNPWQRIRRGESVTIPTDDVPWRVKDILLGHRTELLLERNGVEKRVEARDCDKYRTCEEGKHRGG